MTYLGAKIIDTPGIKGFGVVDMEPLKSAIFLNFKLKEQQIQ
jgi:putative ribosome biogenesis GTPase RsgA